jgi:centrosomal protein CEP76
MTGLKFESKIHQSHNQSVNSIKLSSENRASKTVPKFMDKNQEFAIPLNKVNVDPSKRHLYLQILNGKAFIEYLTQSDIDNDGQSDVLPGYNHQSPKSFFTIYIHFRGQRFKTRSFACTCEPKINEGFLLELHKDHIDSLTSLMADAGFLLSISDPIHIVMIRTDLSQENHLVSSHLLEWRTVLSHLTNKQTISIELMGTGPESKIPAGILNICIQLVPSMDEPLKEDLTGAQLGLEHSKSTERERLFLVYAKQWWKEYQEIREDNKNRLVKIFAQDENGLNRPVCSYIRPMRTGRLLDTPRQAARFVSLIAYDKVTSSFGSNEQIEQWMHMHTFLAKNKGDCENHSILLCNLLLGFGLDAYVCVGTKLKNQPHTWVVTISYDYSEIVFWESLTGNRYLHLHINPDDPPLDKNIVVKHPYKTIGCLFNHKNFYANIQTLSNVDTCCFHLKDQSKWKSMSEDAIQTVCNQNMNYFPPLCQNLLDPTLISNDLEHQLRALIVSHRQDIGLTTNWDDNLSYILSPALAWYENERVTGMSIGNEEFDQAIKLAIPDGHTFKAFPIQFIHKNARKIFAYSLKKSICEEILTCRGDQVKLALRVRVFTYPDSAIATWVMFACRYKIVV